MYLELNLCFSYFHFDRLNSSLNHLKSSIKGILLYLDINLYLGIIFYDKLRDMYGGGFIHKIGKEWMQIKFKNFTLLLSI